MKTMKLLPTLFLIFIYSVALSQEKEFQIQAQIVDTNAKPVGDVYILNYRNLDKAVSRPNGVFDMSVLPGDSLMISHVSYVNKIIRVFDILVNPVVQIEMDTINILQVNVSPEQKTDYDRARENLMFLSELKVPKFEKIKPEETPVMQMIKEHNSIFRSEASSISILRFSPSGITDKAKKRLKNRQQSNQYSSTRKHKKSYPENSR
jgi:hypothetical protein